MEDTEYELVAHEEVDRLKREVERLKSNPFVQNSSEDRLYESISRLNDSVNKLYALFENVNKQLMKEYQMGNSPEEKLDKILEQNKSIAEALVSIGSKMSPEEEDEEPIPVHAQAIKPQTSHPQAQIQQHPAEPRPNTYTQPTMQARPAQMTPSPLPVQRAPVQPPQQVQIPSQQIQQNSFEQAFSSQKQPMPVPYPEDNFIPSPGQSRFQQSSFPKQNMAPQDQVMPPPLQPQRQMAPQMQPSQPYKQVYSQEDIFNPPVPSPQPPQSHPFESGININYPTPDRFQSINAPPSIEPPIDLVPPEPKKRGIGGLLSGILKK